VLPEEACLDCCGQLSLIPGAYAESCLAIQRAHAAGLRAGCNVFLTTTNAPQAERLLGALQRLQVDGMAWDPATYHPTARGRRNERLRPALLVCRPDLDLHTGMAGLYRERHGNLRTDGGQAVLSRALEQGGRSIDAVWFGPGPLPAVGELAARHGDRSGQGVHFTETSVRYLWLDRAQRA
jgi:hypothetical protein